MSANLAPAHNYPETTSDANRGETAYGGQTVVAPSNRRIDPRYPMAIRVSYPRRNAFFFEYTRNISRGGMFIGTKNPMELGERFLFELDVPGEDEPMAIVGEVRWRVTPEEVSGIKDDIEDLEVGMGIAFIFDDDASQHTFNDKVMEMLYEAFGTEIAHELMRTSPTNR